MCAFKGSTENRSKKLNKMTYNDFQASIIIKAKKFGLSWVQIGDLVEKSANAVRMWYNRWTERQELGEPTLALTSRGWTLAKLAIQEKFREGFDGGYRQLADDLKLVIEDKLEQPSATTTFRLCKELGLERKVAKREQLISKVNVEKRLAFAREWLEKEDYEWEGLIWSDETMARKCPQGKRMWVWTSLEMREDEDKKNYQIHSGGFGVMFWGFFSKYGFGDLVVVIDTMDQHQYIEILGKYLLPYLDYMDQELGLEMTFMQDNAPCHKAERVKQFLDEMNVKRLDWPAQSPDLNPIENLWHIIKARRQKYYGVPATKEDLIVQVEMVWKELEPELAYTLAESAKTRLAVCVERNGKHTGY